MDENSNKIVSVTILIGVLLATLLGGLALLLRSLHNTRLSLLLDIKKNDAEE